ncbi:MAG TPA: SMI1/KNR4 family protein [Pyrinomonadaceae bacterium]|nr:SMI1/KNR4 family protein [Pyrinomonadaceae bacterium]
MEQLGQTMPPMYVTRNEDGSLAASSSDPLGQPIALPASATSIAALEDKVGRALPYNLRQLYAIADGSFGPGLGYSEFGPGLYSIERTRPESRRSPPPRPGFTGFIPWPPHLLPLTDNSGPVSYDLDTGAIIAFDEYSRTTT